MIRLYQTTIRFIHSILTKSILKRKTSIDVRKKVNETKELQRESKKGVGDWSVILKGVFGKVKEKRQKFRTSRNRRTMLDLTSEIKTKRR